MRIVASTGAVQRRVRWRYSKCWAYCPNSHQHRIPRFQRPQNPISFLCPVTAFHTLPPFCVKCIITLQVLHSDHLRKTGGWGSYPLCQQEFGSPSFPRSFPPISTLASLFFNHLRSLSFSVSHLSPIPPAPSTLFAKNQGYL